MHFTDQSSCSGLESKEKVERNPEAKRKTGTVKRAPGMIVKRTDCFI